MKKLFRIACCGLFLSGSASAELVAKTVDYSAADASLEGYVAYDSTAGRPRAGILIVPDWMGPSEFTEKKARALAQDGYVAFVADIYGKGVRPKNSEEAAKLAEQYRGDRKLLRARARAAFDQLKAMKEVDPAKILAIGYCFGGTAALELARDGAPLVGTVSFHGGLSNPTPQDARNIKAPVLILHGGDDPFVPPAEVAAFKKEMDAAGVKYQFITYPGAVHAFTIPGAGSDKTKGAAYDPKADKKSWAEFQKFLRARVK